MTDDTQVRVLFLKASQLVTESGLNKSTRTFRDGERVTMHRMLAHQFRAQGAAIILDK